MGVRDTTTEGKTALFDSTTGEAFGRVFDSPDDVESFLEWLARVKYVTDPRSIGPYSLSVYRDEWEAKK